MFVVLGLEAIILARRYIPDTRDRTLEELEHHFKEAADGRPVVRAGERGL